MSEDIIVGVNDQEQFNAQISEMQSGLEFEPLIEFLERLKEPLCKGTIPTAKDNDE